MIPVFPAEIRFASPKNRARTAPPTGTSGSTLLLTKKKRKRKEKRRARQKKGERKKRREKKEIRARIGLAVKPENPANFVMKIRGNRQLGLAPRTRIAPRGRCTMIRTAEAQARTHRYGYAAKGTVKGCSARARPPKQCASVVNEVLLMQTRSPRLF